VHLQKTRLIKTIRFNVLREEPRRETLALEEVVDGGCGRERMEKEKKQSEERHGRQRHCHRITELMLEYVLGLGFLRVNLT
jgi:hypothetical protein